MYEKYSEIEYKYDEMKIAHDILCDKVSELQDKCYEQQKIIMRLSKLENEL